MRAWLGVLGVGVVLTHGCGTEPVTYASIAGSYGGAFGAVAVSGNTYAGEFTLQLTQAEGSLSGTWSANGSINGGAPRVREGLFVGSMSIGENPAVSGVISEDHCPSIEMPFAGTFDSSTEVLSLLGTLESRSSTCTLVGGYELSLELTR